MNADKRVRGLARNRADNFDATILHNRVSEQVRGSHTTEDDLTRLVELAESCYQFSADRGESVSDDEVASAAFGAAEELNDRIDDLVDVQVARACAEIVTEAPEWTDHWDEEEIADAVHEAREWLQLHEAAAERAGVLEEVQADA
ncbi:hypothetical protein [Halosimplex pelagicum]|uniref:Uncharacterized protein n=1 Tax=Halosimplex pelagicum TaxID=869886 RepID=A0A7D5P9C4_9EURY|nr:hypothetical protein [Halosimplex pelagicum]QLH82445.1 hypothetical protein HZS54_12840 [Halosimplex pelagicum]QLH82501.1 hypothetical protein HZS54_13145 [Halosimplex pelagicum]